MITDHHKGSESSLSRTLSTEYYLTFLPEDRDDGRGKNQLALQRTEDMLHSTSPHFAPAKRKTHLRTSSREPSPLPTASAGGGTGAGCPRARDSATLPVHQAEPVPRRTGVRRRVRRSRHSRLSFFFFLSFALSFFLFLFLSSLWSFSISRTVHVFVCLVRDRLPDPRPPPLLADEPPGSVRPGPPERPHAAPPRPRPWRKGARAAPR